MKIDTSKRIRGEVPPDIIVIGAMRAGTTTLYEMMRASSAVAVPRMKETDYFLDRQYKRGLSWLNRQYDDLNKPIVDVSPNYSKRYVFPDVARRIHETNPNVRLIYIFRDPIKRAISQFRHLSAMGYDPKFPHETEPRTGQCVGDASLYFEQLQPYLKFWSIEQIEILEFEDLVADQFSTLRGLYQRLGLPDAGITTPEVHANSSEQLQRVPHWWGRMRNQPVFEWLRSKTPRGVMPVIKSLLFHGQGNTIDSIEFPDAAIDQLRQTLSADVEALRQLTGRTFDRWSI